MSNAEIKKNPAIGKSWEEVEKELFTPEEIAASDLRVELICALIEARKEKGITQKELEEMTGIKQSAIARVERGNSNPKISTLTKLLAPLGKRLAVVPI